MGRGTKSWTRVASWLTKTRAYGACSRPLDRLNPGSVFGVRVSIVGSRRPPHNQTLLGGLVERKIAFT